MISYRSDGKLINLYGDLIWAFLPVVPAAGKSEEGVRTGRLPFPAKSAGKKGSGETFSKAGVI